MVRCYLSHVGNTGNAETSLYSGVSRAMAADLSSKGQLVQPYRSLWGFSNHFQNKQPPQQGDVIYFVTPKSSRIHYGGTIGRCFDFNIVQSRTLWPLGTKQQDKGQYWSTVFEVDNVRGLDFPLERLRSLQLPLPNCRVLGRIFIPSLPSNLQVQSNLLQSFHIVEDTQNSDAVISVGCH